MNFVLWTREEFDEENASHLVAFVRARAGICAGLSYSWIQGILKDRKGYNSMPDLQLAIYFQHVFGGAPNLQSYPQYTHLESVRWHQTEDRVDALNIVWNSPGSVDGQSVGIWIAMIPKTGSGHAAAFMRFGHIGYLMESLESYIHVQIVRCSPKSCPPLDILDLTKKSHK